MLRFCLRSGGWVLKSNQEIIFMGESFKDLVVWQRAIEMTRTIYKLTSAFPATERYGLSDQLRRAAVSVPSNIAEGYGRLTRGEYLQFLGHARGSNCEVETQLVIAESLGFGTAACRAAAEKLCTDVSRLLGGLIKSLRA
jgi:four helix bundle protein